MTRMILLQWNSTMILLQMTRMILLQWYFNCNNRMFRMLQWNSVKCFAYNLLAKVQVPSFMAKCSKDDVSDAPNSAYLGVCHFAPTLFKLSIIYDL